MKTSIDMVKDLAAVLSQATMDSPKTWETEVESTAIKFDKMEVFPTLDLASVSGNFIISCDTTDFKPGVIKVFSFESDGLSDVSLSSDFLVVKDDFIKGEDGNKSSLIIISVASNITHKALAFWYPSEPINKITMSDSAPTGGKDGDIHFEYA